MIRFSRWYSLVYLARTSESFRPSFLRILSAFFILFIILSILERSPLQSVNSNRRLTPRLIWSWNKSQVDSQEDICIQSHGSYIPTVRYKWSNPYYRSALRPETEQHPNTDVSYRLGCIRYILAYFIFLNKIRML